MGPGGVSEDLDADFLVFAERARVLLDQARTDVARQASTVLSKYQSSTTAVEACCASIIGRIDREFPPDGVEQKVHRAAIHACLLQGADAVRNCIERAHYPQAAALVRQEIEAVECLRGLRQGKQRQGATPRLKALRHLGRCYADLTSLAHLSKWPILVHVVSSSPGNVDPHFNAEFAKFLYRLHVVALVGAAFDMAELRPFSAESDLSPQEEAWLSALCGYLDSEGVLTPKFADD